MTWTIGSGTWVGIGVTIGSMTFTASTAGGTDASSIFEACVCSVFFRAVTVKGFEACIGCRSSSSQTEAS